MAAAGKSAPTGCYKCGLPGHWSRDCTADPVQSSNPNPRPTLPPSSSIPRSGGAAAAARAAGSEDKPAKPKKVPAKRPKLTPELLLSDDGLGYVLRHFPRNFKYRSRGNERCIRELRERVASGGDPTKLHEPPPPKEDGVNDDQGLSTPFEFMDAEEPTQNERESLNNANANDLPEDILDEIYEKAIEDPPPTSQGHDVLDSANESQKQDSNTVTSNSTNSQISDEQKARMELSRLKALEKAAARSHLQQGS
ncbi:hypothetical protein EUGRSUZ_J01834 [Eucalyptus grandis]|uniref:Uncharacterized protein n=2 Tax=Eucalyptus grandis TaxID=71139 RepID=A0ACC3J6K2_EUCGR|nr:hypothetical protein EUGRSUZ_J01834 [Eucalyptus grandis]